MVSQVLTFVLFYKICGGLPSLVSVSPVQYVVETDTRDATCQLDSALEDGGSHGPEGDGNLLTSRPPARLPTSWLPFVDYRSSGYFHPYLPSSFRHERSNQSH